MQKVLVIEDDRSLHKAFRRLFEGEGYAVEFAADGAAGLAAFRAAAPVLVLLDLKLPKVPGREVCRLFPLKVWMGKRLASKTSMENRSF